MNLPSPPLSSAAHQPHTPDPVCGVALRAAEWINAQIDQFRLPRVPNNRLFRLLKPLGELALTAQVVQQHADVIPGVAESAHAWLEFAWQELRSGEVLMDVLEPNPDLIVMCTIYPPFYEAGLRHPALEAFLRRAISIRGVQRLEYPAWRRLDIAHALDAVGISSPWNADATFADTWLAGMPEPWSISEAAAYSVTHTVFYRTTFGARPSGIPSDICAYLNRWIPVWAEYCWRVGNYDLLGEWLMVAGCLGYKLPGSWGEKLSGVQRADGAVPGPDGAGVTLDPQVTDEPRREFFTHYHTTLVAVMTGILSANAASLQEPAPAHPTATGTSLANVQGPAI